ncbi:rod shape-determining protein [Jidongwangia harbinensis]|uniref:rod shape-determining protein n=1 Tax=Jidongwangia harbinensis TaxID=2878561 RepID=UPI001CD966E4|nr:rod shape-determining protein [Jidongwangia harbinensis]MCA2218856.1 rod shape-determining protein [Jidongwangia harbinensis]
MTSPARPAVPAPPARQHRATGRRTTSPTTLAVDLGSCTIGVWAARRGTVSGPCGDTSASVGSLVRRGRVVDIDGCITLLSQLARQYPEPVPPGGVVVACRPVLATDADQDGTRRVLDAVFAPTRLLFIDTVRAAAIGSGAHAGTLLVVDVGAELTEVALLQDGRVIAARRTEIGTRDVKRGATVDLISDNVLRHVDDLRAGSDALDLRAAGARGVLLVGDGALYPGLAPAISGMLRVRVHRAAAPRTAALNGAGLAAMSLLRHPAVA